MVVAAFFFMCESHCCFVTFIFISSNIYFSNTKSVYTYMHIINDQKNQCNGEDNCGPIPISVILHIAQNTTALFIFIVSCQLRMVLNLCCKRKCWGQSLVYPLLCNALITLHFSGVTSPLQQLGWRVTAIPCPFQSQLGSCHVGILFLYYYMILK